MTYRITGADPAKFQHLWGRDEATLATHRAVRVRADAMPGYPERTTLSDAEPGDVLLLVNHVSLSAHSPYHATHAIYVHDGPSERFDAVDELPPVFWHRPQSLRAFDGAGMMRAADIADGKEIGELIRRFFDDAEVAEIHAHNARQGCFNARIVRA